jgi:2-polyprenyl-6-methoxyphenol hydroxylase-like FAD-dependent oxidoreductase
MLETRCCIAGGGPAGMMLGYLLARSGIEVVVLEKHDDFLRDFRGDTVHPSTLSLMKDLGLLEEFLRLPHQRLSHVDGYFGAERVRIAEFSGLPSECAFIALMPQWDFLQFLAEKCRAFPSFRVLMGAKLVGLRKQSERVVGVQAETHDGPLEVLADLVVGCDGRTSTVRQLAGLKPRELGSPIDVLWFRVKRDPDIFDDALAHVGAGRVLVTLNRGDYYQCAYVIAKGAFESVKARGLEAFRADVASLPTLRPHIAELRSWDDVKLLSVTVDRLEKWSASGLLCIGDAAHAMSPVGGVGINLAIQDAVATANLLTDPLRRGRPSDADLERVQARRAFPTRVTQAVQIQAHERLLAPALLNTMTSSAPPLLMKLATRSTALRRFLGRVVGMGIRPEHIEPGLLDTHEPSASAASPAPEI